MRTLNAPDINQWRLHDTEYGPGNHKTGVFQVLHGAGRGGLCVIASAGDGWDHVSVSCQHRIPLWSEMEHIKRLFFKPTEYAFQLHPPIEDYIDGSYPGGQALNTLHLWRPIPPMPQCPRPPRYMVGGMTSAQADKEREDMLARARTQKGDNEQGLGVLINALGVARVVLTDEVMRERTVVQRSGAVSSPKLAEALIRLASVEKGLEYLHKAKAKTGVQDV
jgi:hypothetical protein